MKKVFALILALACVFCCAALVSCGDTPTPPDDGGNTPNPDNPDDGNQPLDLSAFNTAVNNTDPASSVITTVMESELGELNGRFEITYNEDGTSSIEYSYEKFLPLDAEGTETKETVTGTVNVQANGSFSDGASFNGQNSVAVSFKLTLDVEKLDGAKVEGNSLIATVKAANTKAVLGVELASDVTLIVVKGETGLTSVSMSYAIDVSGLPGTASVACDYNY